MYTVSSHSDEQGGET